MPRRELPYGQQVADWLAELGSSLKAHGNMVLLGSAGLLWQAQDRGLAAELPDASMDVDPVTDSEEVAAHCYEALIGSDFERVHGWRVPEYRERLLRHWKDPRHPHAERFARYEAEVTRILETPKGSDAEVDKELRQRNLSLRVVVKEIPSVFGSFF